MASIGTLAVNLIAKTSVFDRKMRSSKKTLKGFTSDIAKTQRQVVNFAKGIMVAAGVSGLGFMIKRTMESIDATAKLSDRLKIATEDLVALQHAAKISGMDTEGMNKALETFVRRIGEVKMGVGQAKYALDGLGLSAEQLSKRDHIDNLKLIADRINQLPTAADRASAAYYLFGRQGVKMLNLLQKGGEGIEEFRREAEKLGIVFSRFDAAKVEAANDAITRAKAKMQGYVNLLTIELAPSIEAVADKLTNFAKSGDEVREKMINVTRAITKGFAFIGDMIHVVTAAAKGVAGAMVFSFGNGALIIEGLLKVVELAYNKIVKLQNKIADTTIGKKLSIDAMSEVDLTSGIAAWRESLYTVSGELFKDAGEDLANLPTTKVDKWFEDLERRSARLKENLEEAAKAKENFAKTDSLIDAKSVLESTKNVIESIRNQNYLTRMERIEALREYARENATTLQQVAEANKLLNEEITNLEKSRVNKLKVYMAELREDMQNIGLYISDKMADVAQSIESSISNAFTSMMAEGANFKDAMKSFALEIRNAYIRAFADIIAKQMMAQATSGIVNNVMGGVMGFAGSILGGFFGGGATIAPDPNPMMAYYAHGGGTVGRLSRSRTFPASVFAGAPRLHDGLASDEYPTILQKDETVIPKGGGVPMPGVVVNINNQTGQNMETSQKNVSFDGEKMIVDIVVKNYHQGGEIRNLFGSWRST